MDGPYRKLDPETAAILSQILAEARHGVLGCLDPAGGAPLLSRVAVLRAGGQLLTLLSGLAAHSRALAADGRAGLFLAPPPGKGDPMAQPRLSLQVAARRLPPDPALRETWRRAHPKSAAWIDLPDFSFWRLEPSAGLLNAGFGRAVPLSAAQIAAA